MKKVLRLERQAPSHWGGGFPVRQRISIERDARNTSPFLMLDHTGPSAVPRSTNRSPITARS